MALPTGIHWYKGYYAQTKSPLVKQVDPSALDGWPYEVTYTDTHAISDIYVHGGPWVCFRVFGWEISVGFKPYPTWLPGFGNEGVWTGAARWLKRHDMGNLSGTFRRY